MNHLQSVNRSILLPTSPLCHYGYLTTYSMMIHDWWVLPIALQLTGSLLSGAALHPLKIWDAAPRKSVTYQAFLQEDSPRTAGSIPGFVPSPSCQACGCGFPGRADPVPPAPPGCTRARVHQTPGFLPLRQRGRALAVGGATTGMWSTGRAKKPPPMSCWYCLVLFCGVNRLYIIYKTSNISIIFHHASIFFPHLGEPNTTFGWLISGAWQVSEASGDWGQPRTIWFAPGQVNSTCDLERTIEDWGLKQNPWEFFNSYSPRK